MVKVTGIDIEPSVIHLVELDGSSRKFRVTKAVSKTRTAPEPGAPADAAAEAARLGDDLKDAVHDGGVSRERCLLAVSGAHCVLRNITLPFKGRDEIRKVLKFEAESYIHSRSIDEVVVDAIHIGEREEQTDLFMAACPKDTLATLLKGLNKAGFDPERADLSAALLVQAAEAMGTFAPDAGGEDAAPPIDLLLEVAHSSITMVVVEGGELKTVRVLRWGLDRLGHLLADELGIAEPEAVAEIDRFLGRGAGEEPSPAAATADAEEAAPRAERPPARIGEADLAQGANKLAERIGREAMLFLSGCELSREPRRALVTGLGARLPGLLEALEQSLEVPVQKLDLFEQAEVAGAPEAGGDYEVAFAAAMAGIGAAKPMLNFRQEDLVFRPKFDRLKFPLAIMTMFLVVWQVAIHINHRRAIAQHETAIGTPVRTSTPRTGPRKDLPKYGDRSLLWQIAWPEKDRGTLNEQLDEKDAEAILRKVAERPPIEKTRALVLALADLKKKLEMQTGYFAELKLPSGLAVLQAFAAAIHEADKSPTTGRFVIPKIELSVGDKKSSPGALRFSLDVQAEGGDEWRQQKVEIERILRAACGPQGPFKELRQEGKESIYKDAFTAGAKYDFVLDLNGEIPVSQKRVE